MNNRTLIISFCSLTIGIAIYLLFRISSLKIFSWLNFVNINFLDSKIRKIAFHYSQNLPDWFLYSLPDGLWISSYIFLMFYIWNFRINFKSLFWITIIPFTAILSEILQSFRIISGTLDYVDLTFYILGLTLPFLIYIKKIILINKL